MKSWLFFWSCYASTASSLSWDEGQEKVQIIAKKYGVDTGTLQGSPGFPSLFFFYAEFCTDDNDFSFHCYQLGFCI